MRFLVQGNELEVQELESTCNQSSTKYVYIIPEVGIPMLAKKEYKAWPPRKYTADPCNRMLDHGHE